MSLEDVQLNLLKPVIDQIYSEVLSACDNMVDPDFQDNCYRTALSQRLALLILTSIAQAAPPSWLIAIVVSRL